ncbi:hypothetical protein D3C85_115510 [compost metagenome]
MGNGIGVIVVELGREVGGPLDRGSHIPDPRIAEISQDAQLIGRHGEEVSPTDKWRAPFTGQVQHIARCHPTDVADLHQAAG